MKSSFRLTGASSIASTPMILTALVVLTMALPDALAQGSYTDKPIRIIVPNSPGGTVDMIARLVAQGLSERLGWRVVVDNRPGAGTVIGSDVVAKAPPDGYTLLMSVSTLAINPATYKKMPYDALRDFAPITEAAFVPNLFVVHPSVPAKSVKELIALAKARPGEMNYGSAGSGSMTHLAAALFVSGADAKIVHVPYKGVGAVVPDLMAGQVQMMTVPIPPVLPLVQAGRLKALGVTTLTRSKLLPELPTIDESGLKGYDVTHWYGPFAPAATPRDIVNRLHNELAQALRSPETVARIAKQGAEPGNLTLEQLAQFMKAETAKWSKAVKTSGAKVE